jgi:hypothetical protein
MGTLEEGCRTRIPAASNRNSFDLVKGTDTDGKTGLGGRVPVLPVGLSIGAAGVPCRILLVGSLKGWVPSLGAGAGAWCPAISWRKRGQRKVVRAGGY